MKRWLWTPFLLIFLSVGFAQEDDTLTAGFIYVGPIGDYGWTNAHDEARVMLEEEFRLARDALRRIRTRRGRRTLSLINSCSRAQRSSSRRVLATWTPPSRLLSATPT